MNPATGQVIYEVEVADESVQQAAIESARAGFAQEYGGFSHHDIWRVGIAAHI